MGLNIMKLLAVFLLVACTSDASPTRRALQLNASSPADTNNLITPETDVEAAIKEVENLIKTDPSLPRLTRGEILDIIDNITKSDAKKINNTRDQKAVMLVLPYSPNSSQDGDIQELYTKPPITKIIGENQVDYKKRQLPKKIVSTTTTAKPIATSTIRATTEKFLIMEEFENLPSSQPGIKRRKPMSTTEQPTRTTVAFKPLRRRVTTKSPQTERHPNHKYPEDVFVVKSTPVFATTQKPIEAMRIITPPKFHQIPDKIKLEPQYKPIQPEDFPKFQQIPEKSNKPKPKPTTAPIQDFKPVYQAPEKSKPQYKPTKTKPTSEPESIMHDMNLPDDFKQVLKNLDVLIKEDPKYSSQYESLSPLAMKPPMSQDSVKEMLSAIGIHPSTTTTSMPDVQQVANNLSPDMKDLLMSFGLIPDPNKKVVKKEELVAYIEPTSDVHPDSYSSFKPLPSAGVSTGNSEDGMEELLAKYGLGARSQKSISIKKPQMNSFDAVPDDLKGVLTDIGLTNKDVVNLTTEKVKKEKPQHVFSPADNQFATDEEINKLNQLAGVIKQLERLNGSATEEDLKDIDLDGLKQLVGSLNVPLDEQIGPNPLDFDTSFEKNEVKRQQSTTTEVSAKNPSIAALEDSFGGASSEPVAEVELPATEAPKKTGFYYLVDWNTFLDIDNQKGKRVNLRFQPTIGDPSRFLSVSVP